MASFSKKRKLASLAHPSIEAALGGLYRLPSEDEARTKLAQLRLHFIVSRGQEEEGSLTLWVRGYGLSEEEKKDGYLGHFVCLTPHKHGKHWTITAAKREVELKRHPIRRYTLSAQHPNWGHPLLRAIRKGKEYATPEAAQADLLALHTQYPEASIPGQGKLYLMIYGREANPAKPVQKYVLEVKAVEAGGFTISARLNVRKARPLMPAAEPQKPQGYFSSLVQLKRKRKPTGG